MNNNLKGKVKKDFFFGAKHSITDLSFFGW